VPSPAAGFQVTGEAFDVSAAGREQRQLTLLAPGGELPPAARSSAFDCYSQGSVILTQLGRMDEGELF
jgi:hypothetical protein